VPVHDDDTPDKLAIRVFEEECEALPEAIALFSQGRVSVEGRKVRVHKVDAARQADETSHVCAASD
jgi:folate-dependent phosphoribosylglycinamide formyltransferase PurN